MHPLVTVIVTRIRQLRLTFLFIHFQAQEDAEVLRSLVEPLEEEIKALKEKLRSTDDDLQKYVGAGSNNSPARSPTCGKCVEWELEASTKAQRVETLDKQVVRLHEDLERESRLRGELEKEWQEKKEEHKDALTELTDQLKKSEEQMFLLTVSGHYYNTCRGISPNFHLLAAKLQQHPRRDQPGAVQGDFGA